ncbi:MAG: hypothetical protein JW855_00290 [Gammaproteobacteria bacterium]|nr:hypothetical protein [Gammaproteobacteria bacterium]
MLNAVTCFNKIVAVLSRFSAQFFLIILGIFLPVLVFAQTIAAIQGTGQSAGFGTMAENVTTSFLGTGKDILYAACYIIGIILLITANNRYRIHHVAPRGLGVANSVFIALSGLLLILIPILTKFIPGASG